MALQCYTDITVLVLNDFGHGFAVFGAFCCGFAVFATPSAPLKHVGSREGSRSWQQRGRKVEESPRKVMKLEREGG